MRKININGIEFEVPANITGRQLRDIPRVRQQAAISNDDTLVEVHEGRNAVVNDGDKVNSDQLITMPRWASGGKDIRRLNAELQLLEMTCGPENVEWASDCSFVKINDFRLPTNLNKPNSDVLVFVPENYGNGTPYRDAFLTPGLKIRTPSGWKDLGRGDHYFEAFPYSSRLKEQAESLQNRGWAYICLHQTSWKKSSNILTFLTQIFTYLSDPEKHAQPVG